MTTPADWQKLVDRTRRLRELLEEALQLDATIDTGLKYSGAGFLENVNNIDFAIQDMKGFEICRADPSAYLWWMKRVDRLEGLDEIYSEFVEYPAEFQLFLAFDHRFCDRYPDLAVSHCQRGAYEGRSFARSH